MEKPGNPTKLEFSPAEEEAITNILLSIVELEDELVDTKKWELNYGNKRLEIIFEEDSFGTYIENVLRPPKERQTTLLYEAARRLMYQISKEKNEEFIYLAMTYNKKLHKWLETTGEKVFGWQNKATDKVDGRSLYTYYHNVCPK